LAKVDIKMPEEFLEKISRLGSDFDAVAESVLEAGGEVVLARVKGNLSSVVGQGTKYDSRSTESWKVPSAFPQRNWTGKAITMSKLALWSHEATAVATPNSLIFWNTASMVSPPSRF